MSCSMTRRSDAGEARNRGPLVSSSQCLNTKCGQSKRIGTGPGRRPDWAGYGSRLFGQTHSCHPFVSERKYGHIHGCQKSLAVQMPKLRKRAIRILSLLKKGGLYLAALKKGGGGIRAHIRTMSYIGSYPPPPPPPPPENGGDQKFCKRSPYNASLKFSKTYVKY